MGYGGGERRGLLEPGFPRTIEFLMRFGGIRAPQGHQNKRMAPSDRAGLEVTNRPNGAGIFHREREACVEVATRLCPGTRLQSLAYDSGFTALQVLPEASSRSCRTFPSEQTPRACMAEPSTRSLQN